MKEKLLLVGAGGLGRVVLEHAMQLYECSFVDDGFEPGTKVCGIKVVGNTRDMERLFGIYKLLFVSIGDNVIREKLYDKARKIGFGFPNIVHESVYISPFASVGKGCLFLNNVVIQNGASIGDGVILNPGVEAHHDCSIDDYALIYTNSVVRTKAEIGKRTKIGSNCTVSNDVILLEDSVIKNGCTI